MSDDKVPEVTRTFVCGDCVHCQPGPNTHTDVLSRNCYRMPPTAVGIPTTKGIMVMSIRPEIRVDTFACGEYETEDDDDGAPTLAGMSPGLTS